MEKLFSKSKAFTFNRLGNERGMAFVTTILLLIVLALLIAVSTKWSAQDIKRTANYTKSRDSFYTAETGIQRALDWLNYDPATGKCRDRGTTGYDAELVAQAAGGGTEWPNSLFKHPDNGFYNDGYYDVTIANNPDGGSSTSDLDKAVILTSRGVKRGLPTTVEALIHRGLIEIDGGLITNDELKFHGNAQLLGAGGTAHTNDVLEESGTSIYAENGTSATEDCQGTTTCKDPWYDAPKEIPWAAISDYVDHAHFTLQRVGGEDQIDVHNNSTNSSYDTGLYQSFLTCTPDTASPLCSTDPTTGVTTCPDICTECWKRMNGASPYTATSCGDIMSGAATDSDSLKDKAFTDAWAGLSPNSGDWKIQGVVPDGMFHIPNEGSLVVLSTGSEPADGVIPCTGCNDTDHVWQSTILVEGNLKFGANALVDNFTAQAAGPTMSEAEKLLFFTVGRDLRIVGGARLGVGALGTKGWISVHDQFDIAGNMNLNGFILSSGICVSNTGGSSSAESSAGNDLTECPGEKGYVVKNEFGGNAIITYDLDIDPDLGSCKAEIQTWREITGAG